MIIIHLIAIIYLSCLVYFYQRAKAAIAVPEKRKKPVQKAERGDDRRYLWILLAVAFVIRTITAFCYKGHETDINCFLIWEDMVYQDGFSNFYSSGAFTDYPPGYMYILYIIGWLKQVIGLEYDASFAVYLTKLVPILCDLGTAGLLYRIAKEHFHKKGALILAGLYLFNPAVFLNSAVWGQVDAVFTLFVLAMCYMISQNKLIPAYFLLGIGILMKPQMMLLAPVLLFGIVNKVLLQDFSWKRFFIHLGSGLLAIGMMLLAALPFGLQEVISQYKETMKSYPYASVNAYNFWAMLGQNWQPQENVKVVLSNSTWGMLFIVVFLCAAVFLSFKCREKKSKYYFLGAFIVICMFCLSVRMHERYIFPAMILLLAAFAVRPKKELFFLYSAFSILHFYNAAHVLFYYDYQDFNRWEPLVIVLSAATMIALLYLFYCAFRFYYLPYEEGRIPTPSETPVRLVKIDWILMAVITFIYACIAFTNLGDRQAPETKFGFLQWESFTVDMGKTVTVDSISWFNGLTPNALLTLDISDDGENWSAIYTQDAALDTDSVLCWHKEQVFLRARYFHFMAVTDQAQLKELIFTDVENNVLTPTDISFSSDREVDDFSGNTTTVVLSEKEAGKPENLFDEQAYYPEFINYKNGTYFDEIYHARSAYELMNRLYCYEWTHPPLGKILISVGIAIWGMNPFGWRFMGTLFGVLMLPVLFLFAKRFFRQTWIAGVVTTLFAFDFMHYVQTRIATIDVYVTFFIILMYFFMYLYTRMNFYDTPLKKTFLPLGLCGISMGLGIASKWTGVYAGVGLGIIFFYVMYKRYREYVYAKEAPKSVTENIKHSYITENFKKLFAKTISFCIVFFVVIPAVIYLLSYIPFRDGTGHGLYERMKDNQESMLYYHSNLEAEHPYSSKWYQWPVMYRPIFFYSGGDLASEELTEGISSFGNPLVWWAGLPAFVYMLYLLLKKNDRKAAFLTVGYLAQYAPWFLVSRVIFIYHYFPSVPFVVMMVGYSFYRFAEGSKEKRAAVYGYTAVAIGLFILFYPVLTGIPVEKTFVENWLRWFDSWVLAL